jgi:hypothetical protein
LGLWVGPDWQVASLIPWDPVLLDFLTLNSKTTHLLVVAQRKMYDREFCVPFQEVYEPMVPDEVRSRYSMVVDGEIMDGRRVKYLTKDTVLAGHYNVEIMSRDNIIASMKGQIDSLRHELAVTKYQLDKARYDEPQQMKEVVEREHVRDAELRLSEILNSTSWRITAPLRYAKGLLTRKHSSRKSST